MWCLHVLHYLQLHINSVISPFLQCFKQQQQQQQQQQQKYVNKQSQSIQRKSNQIGHVLNLLLFSYFDVLVMLLHSLSVVAFVYLSNPINQSIHLMCIQTTAN